MVVPDRDLVESGSDIILAGADTLDVAFLVVGDPYCATTHMDLVVRAKEVMCCVKKQKTKKRHARVVFYAGRACLQRVWRSRCGVR